MSTNIKVIIETPFITGCHTIEATLGTGPTWKVSLLKRAIEKALATLALSTTPGQDW